MSWRGRAERFKRLQVWGLAAPQAIASARHTDPQPIGDRAHQEYGASDRRDRALTSFDELKALLKFYLFLSRVKDAQIVLKEKKQKKKFSEPDFLRS